MNVLMVEPGKAPYETQIGDDLQSMQALVGGYLEAVYPFEQPVALVCRESGKLDGLPLNRALRDSDGDIYDIVAVHQRLQSLAALHTAENQSLHGRALLSGTP